MKRTITLILTLICALATWAQSDVIEVSSHVVDAKTGEALPYVNIYVAPGIGTITNADGDFTLKVNPEASLRISFVGYETTHVKASNLPQRLKLTPMSRTLSEVEVIPWETILVKAGNKLNKDFTKHRKENSQFFYRLTTTYRRKNMAEAFISAKSATNLRDITFLKGRYGKLTPEGLTRPTIANMNFHHPLELGPKIAESRFWSALRTPIPEIPSVHYLSIYYDIEGEELTDNKGGNIYKFNLKRKKTKNQFCILTGTLYVDVKTLKVLKFEGQVENMFLDIFKDYYHTTSRILLDLTVNYSHDKGYTQVQSIIYHMNNGDMSSQAILYNVDDMDLNLENNKKKSKKTGENMLASISDAGFDQILWNHSNIVQRTKEEEMLAGMTDQSIEVNDSLEERPSTPMDILVDHLKRFGQALPQEKVYVHLDNTCYFIGDTIWFSAYTTQTNDGKPSKISGVLYVELYNQEGYLVERKLVEMTNGRGYANFIIDDDAYAGYYELRAYTRWQLNWGLYERQHAKDTDEWFYSKELQHNFFRDYDKLYSRVFPVYDKPKEKGEYAELMTRKTMRRVYKRDPHTRKRQLTFYPEGGELVVGLPCRVAFEATWDDGQQLEGAIGDAKAENRGRGTIEVTPSAKEKRELTFTTTDGAEVKARLPEAVQTGVSLRVNVGRDSIDITVRRTNDLLTDTLGLTIMREGVLQQFHPLEGETQHLRLANNELKAGVNQATVFDSNGRVWADRLFFVKDSTTIGTNVTISGVKDSYKPYEPIVLTVNTPAKTGGNMSLTVRDASHRDVLYDNASLMTEMLLSSEIKGFVPNPEFYFEHNDNIHNRALDLLMLTQGWRRFKWQDMAVRNAWQLTQSAERTPIITGKVYKTPKEFFEYDPITNEQMDLLEEDADQHFSEIDSYDTGWSESPNNTNANSNADNHWQQNVDELLSANNGKTNELADIIYYPGDYHSSFAKKGLRVHTEWVSDDSKQIASIDLDTKDGYFKVQLPRYYGDAFFFLSAADTLKWKKKKYKWIELETDEINPSLKHHAKWRVLPPDYQVMVNFPYPRFVNPYNYYQTHLNYSYDPLLSPTVLNDGSLQIDEVNVWGKHNTLRALQDSMPALIVDAYDAYNAAIDAGLGLGTDNIVRAYLGDYGVKRPYVHDESGIKDYKVRERFGYDINRRGMNNVTMNPDSVYLRRNLHSFPKYDGSEMTYGLSGTALAKYYDHAYVDKYVIYTDYEPRLWGSERYAGDDLPETQIAIYPYPDDSRRAFYRDRRYILPGFSYVNEFYHPNYAKRRMDEHPEDYRRTLYWNPFFVLDEEGKATIMFYNNGSAHAISVDMQGFSDDGTLLSGSK